MKKRIVPIALALVMCLALLPAAVSAEPDEDTYTITLNINKDGVPWVDHGKTFIMIIVENAIYKPRTGLSDGATVVFTDVPRGAYNLRNTEDASNYVFTVPVIGDVSVDMNYYTVTFDAVAAGYATGVKLISSAAGKADGMPVQSGDTVLSGRLINFTAIGEGASLYTFAWRGGSASATTQSFSIRPQDAPLDITCTVTGNSPSTVKEIKIATQPTRLTRYSSIFLTLTGLTVDLTMDDGTTETTITGVGYADFYRYGIEVTIDGKRFNSSIPMGPDQHGKPFVLSVGQVSAQTNPLTMLCEVRFWGPNNDQDAGPVYGIEYSLPECRITPPVDYLFDAWQFEFADDYYRAGDIFRGILPGHADFYVRWRRNETSSTLEVTPDVVNVPADASSTTVSVIFESTWLDPGSTYNYASWLATSDSDWLKASPSVGSSYRKSGILTLNVAANTGDARTGTITLTGDAHERKITVIQAAEGEEPVGPDEPIGGGGTTPPVVWIPDTDTPLEVPPKPFPFIDVHASDWFYSDVYYGWACGLLYGTTETTFSPYRPVTRGMVATLLHRVAGSPDYAGLPNPFGDVPEGKWYSGAVKWAAANGIVLGFGGMFRPEDNITRQDLAVIFARYADYAASELTEILDHPSFGDGADIAGYAWDAVELFFRAGIIEGKPNNRFDPKGISSRCELAAMLHRYLEATAEQ